MLMIALVNWKLPVDEITELHSRNCLSNKGCDATRKQGRPGVPPARLTARKPGKFYSPATRIDLGPGPPPVRNLGGFERDPMTRLVLDTNVLIGDDWLAWDERFRCAAGDLMPSRLRK